MGRERGAARIHACAAIQYGVVGWNQLRDFGFSSATISRRRSDGELIPVYPGVYALPGCRLEWMQRLSAAVLWAGPGAAVAGHAAAELHGLDGVGQKRVEIVVPYARHPSHGGVIVHRARRLTDADLQTSRWPPRTNVGRTLVDLARMVSVKDLERALDSAWRRNRNALIWTAQAIHRQDPRTVPELRGLQELLTTRLNEPTDSDLEALMLPVLREAELPTPILHYLVRGCPWFDPELDFAWPDLRVGLQTDGFLFHSRYRRWVTDRRIRRYLDDLGWQIVEATREDVIERPHEIIDSLRNRFARTIVPHRPL